MDERILMAIVPAIGLVSAMIATYVTLQVKALLAEMQKELAETENRIITRLNGLYVRRTECELRSALLESRLESLAQKREAASD